MKRTIKFFVIIACIILFVSPAHARLRIGLSVGRSMGGDIEESKTVIGSQIEGDLGDGFGVQLSSSTFSDQYSADGIMIDQDLTTWGLSLTYRTPTKPIQGLFLAGINYNIANMDISVDPAFFGLTSAGAFADIDNQWGMHLGGGVSIPLSDHWDIFAEYRYTFLELEGRMTVYGPGFRSSDEIRGDYDFGLLKVGFNYLF